MALTKPPVLPPWAETAGDNVQPTNLELQAGWPLSATPPARQRWNWILNFLANGVRYLTRRGLPDYAADETYLIGDRVIGDDGKTYRSLQDNNINHTPSASPTWWEEWALTLAQGDSRYAAKAGSAAQAFATAGLSVNGAASFTAGLGITGRVSQLHSEANGATKLQWNDSKHSLMLQNGDFTASSVAKLILNTASGSFNNGGIIFVEGSGGYSTGQMVLAVGWDAGGLATERLRLSATSVSVTATTQPSAHNTYDLGTTALRWKDLWLQSGAFNGSDARLKTPVAPLTANEINAAKQLAKEIGTYQWLESIQKKGAAAARHHVGLTVQRAIEIMQANGLDPFACSFIGYDQWGDEFIEHPAIEAVAAKPAVPAEYIEQVVGELVVVDGVEVTVQRKILVEVKAAAPAVAAVEAQAAWTEQKQAAGDAYSFRYDQLNMFIAAGLEARIAELESALGV